MALGGLWHGANWNFVVWGMYNGLLLIGHRAFRAFAKTQPVLDAFRSVVAATAVAPAGSRYLTTGPGSGARSVARRTNVCAFEL